MPPDTRIPKNCPAWLAQWIGKMDERLHSIEQDLASLLKRPVQKDNPKSEDKESDKVTFKWLIEKLLVPAMFMAAGYLLKSGS